eukprot:gene4310-6107_t
MNIQIILPDICPDCNKYFVLSNQSLLRLSMILFLLFVVAELFGASLSNSLSLFGDAAAMSIDVFTYMGNMYAEWFKNRYRDEQSFNCRIAVELIIPTISVCGLIGVNSYIMFDAVSKLLRPDLYEVNIEYLYIFSMVNLLVDLICSVLFLIRGKNLFVEDMDLYNNQKFQLSLDTTVNFESDEEFGILEDDFLFDNSGNLSNSSAIHHSTLDNDISSSCWKSITFDNFFSVLCSSSHTKKNLNMMSAFTHILGDTFRTVAVLSAALVSSIFSIKGDICDSWAAILVSLSIFIVCLPLLLEIRFSILRICCKVDSSNNINDSNDNNGISMNMKNVKYAGLKTEEDNVMF